MADQERSLQLIDTVGRRGKLSDASLQALKKINADKLQLGGPANQYKGDSILLVATLVDDSSSLGVAVIKDPKTKKAVSSSTNFDDPRSNAEAVRIGHNAVTQALLASDNPSAVWFHTRYLNGRILNPWNPLHMATRMDRINYQCGGGTPLYDETVTMLGSVISKTQDFKNNWVAVRTATLIITDGADSGSRLQTPASVKSVTTDMYNMGVHLIAAMGIDDGSTNFRDIFIQMGIRENLILTSGSTPEEIRKAFGLFGKMAKQATNISRFDDTLKGGFLALGSGEK